MHYDKNFSRGLERLQMGEITVQEFLKEFRYRFQGRARYVLNRYRSVYSELTEEDLIQIGITEVLERVGIIRGKGKSKVFDAERAGGRWDLNSYVEFGMGEAMKSAMARSLGRPSAKRGRPPIQHIPTFRYTVNNRDATLPSSSGAPNAAYGIPELRAAEDGETWASVGPEGTFELGEWIEKNSENVYERRALYLIAAGLRSGYGIEEVCRAIEGESKAYGGMRAKDVRRLVARTMGSREWKRPSGFGEYFRPTGGTQTSFACLDDKQTEEIEFMSAENQIVLLDPATLANSGIEDITLAVRGAYTEFSDSAYHLAHILYIVDEHRLWERDGAYASLADFMGRGVGVTESVAKSTGYGMIRAYRVALEVAEERGLDVYEVWSRFGRSKLELTSYAPSEIRGLLEEAGLAGASRTEMQEMLKEAKEISEGADQIEDADVVSEEIRPERPTSNDVAEVRAAEPGDEEQGSTLTVYARVPEGEDIRVPLHSIETGEAVKGVPLKDLDKVYGVYRLKNGTIMSLGVQQKEGKASYYIVRWDQEGGS